MSQTSSSNDTRVAETRQEIEKSLKRRNPIAAMIEEFEPIWFVLCMDAGVISEILYILPYQFNGVKVLSTIAYVIDLVLFITFVGIMLLRFFIYPKQAYTKITGDAEPLTLMGCGPIAFLIIANLTAVNCSNSYWGGYAMMMVGYVLWWIAVVITLFFTAGIYILLFRKPIVEWEQELPPPAIIPAVAVATAGASGAFMVKYSYGMTPQLGLPVVVVGYMLVGLGMFLAIVVWSFQIGRLITHGYPAPEKSPALLILAGPAGQVSTGLQLLGSVASTSGIFANYHSTAPFFQANSAAALDAASIMLSLLVYGFGLFLLAAALTALIEQAIRKRVAWSMTWWASIFPLGVMTTAALAYSIAMDSTAWRVITCVGIIVMVLQFLTFSALTVYNIIFGELLIPKSARKAGKES